MIGMTGDLQEKTTRMTAMSRMTGLTGITTIMDKSPWDCNAIFIFFVISGFPHKMVHPFRNFLAVLPLPTPLTLYKVEMLKTFAHPTLFVG